MVEQTQKVIDDQIDHSRYVSRLSPHARLFVNQLHGHHRIEDNYYSPVLSKRDDRLKRGFELLDADHHALAGQLLGFTDSANNFVSLQKH